MLVARRDPFHPGTHDTSLSQANGARRADSAPSLIRTMTMLQVVGSLLAIPVGIGSAYSIYRANFSVETTCQSLRANIVAMLDKGVDAATRHMLVRRDIEAFEQTCATVDPDASAAFKGLLAVDKAAAPVPAPAVRHVETRPETVARKAEPRSEAKQPAAGPAAVAVEPAPVQRDAATSDSQWLAAVRGALVTHAPDPEPAAAAEAASTAPSPAVGPAPQDNHVLRDGWLKGPAVSAPAVVATAPALPPAMPVAVAPAPPADDGHPVPPASIPAPAPLPNDINASAADSGHTRSRFGELIGHIPLVGWAIER